MKKLFIYLCLLVIIMAGGCQQDDIFNTHSTNQFINIPEDADFSDLSEYDTHLFMIALNRIRFIEDSYGLIQLAPKSAKEAKISGRIYRRVLEMVNRYNLNLLSSEIVTRSDFTADGEYTGYDDNDYCGNDCVAHAIAAALPFVSYAEANYYLTQMYGNSGVPCNRIQSAFGFFGDYEPIGFDYQGEISQSIAIISNGSGGWHAVNVIKIEGSKVYYRDNQATFENSGIIEGTAERINCQIYKFN